MVKFPVTTLTVGNKISGAIDADTVDLTVEEARFLIAAGQAVAPTPMVNTVAPAVSGTAQVGAAALATTNGTWTGSDGVISRQWQSQRDGQGYNNVGATGTTYSPTTDDIGATIRCRVRNINGAGPVYGNSNATSAVIAATALVNTVAPAVTGTAQVGQTLTTTNGTWTGSDQVITRQWQANAGSGFVAISGQTALTLVVPLGQLGSTIRCQVTNTNSLGAVVANSNTTAAVIAA